MLPEVMEVTREQLETWAQDYRLEGLQDEAIHLEMCATMDYAIAGALESCVNSIDRHELEKASIKEIEDALAAMRPQYPGFSTWILENP